MHVTNVLLAVPWFGSVVSAQYPGKRRLLDQISPNTRCNARHVVRRKQSKANLNGQMLALKSEDTTGFSGRILLRRRDEPAFVFPFSSDQSWSSQETWKQTFYRTERDVAVAGTITPLSQHSGGFLYTTAASFHVITLFLFVFACAPCKNRQRRCEGMAGKRRDANRMYDNPCLFFLIFLGKFTHQNKVNPQAVGGVCVFWGGAEGAKHNHIKL